MLKFTQPRTLSDILVWSQKELASQLDVLGAKKVAPLIELQGDELTKIYFLSSYEKASPGALTFAVNEKFLLKAEENKPNAIIIPPALSKKVKTPALVTSEPRLLFALILGLLQKEHQTVFFNEGAYFKDQNKIRLGKNVLIGSQAYIGTDVFIGDNTIIHPQAYIDDGVSIGANCCIHPRAVIRSGVKIGDRCHIHSGAVIGGDGFGYNQIFDPENNRLHHLKNPHIGSVILGDDVDVGSLSTIDKGLVDNTVIGRGTKIDNLVQIGHNCKIGRDCVIVSQVGLAGHSVIGDRVFILGQAGFSHGVVVGDDAIIAGQSGVTRDVPKGRVVWSGSPVRTQDDRYRSEISIKKDLPMLKPLFKSLKETSNFEDFKKLFFEKIEKIKDE